jgi:hypothetical protein
MASAEAVCVPNPDVESRVTVADSVPEKAGTDGPSAMLSRVNGHDAERLETVNPQESDAKLKGERVVDQVVDVLTPDADDLRANESGAV